MTKSEIKMCLKCQEKEKVWLTSYS